MEDKTSCMAYLATKTISPTNFAKITWDLIFGFIYLTCYIIDPFVIAFQYEPIYDSAFNRFQRGLTIALLFNMLQVPFAA